MEQLTKEQVNQLARPFLSIGQRVIDYFKDPAHEADYQAWHMREFGIPAPDVIENRKEIMT